MPQGFSVDVPWDSNSGSIWSTMAFYLFSLHIPLSFGGLSVISQVLKESVLDLQTEVGQWLQLSLHVYCTTD